MTYARKSLISLDDTPYYHVVARCVRRAWLWGFDAYAGRNYAHRKQWVVERLALLASTFAIDVCAYAIMSNHYHLVVRVDRTRGRSWTREEVAARWLRLFQPPEPVKRWLGGERDPAQCAAAMAIVEEWRVRLHDISWFMKSLNEHLARRANAEDDCKGRFWEGRFRSQALLDDAGLLTAMAYVDLNPVRAGVARTPEAAPFTSIYQRIRALNGHLADAQRVHVPLLQFQGTTAAGPTIPFRLEEYLILVDWSGRGVRSDKSGEIGAAEPPILSRLSIDSSALLIALRPQGNVFGRALGRLDRLRLHAVTLGQAWVRGLRQAKRLYST